MMTSRVTDALHCSSSGVASVLLTQWRRSGFSYDRDQQHPEQGEARTTRGHVRGDAVAVLANAILALAEGGEANNKNDDDDALGGKRGE
jgi:hypothetical protein